MTYHNFYAAPVLALAATLLCTPSVLTAQQKTGNAAGARHDKSSSPDMSVPDTDAPHNWTEQQILSATVHQAWELAGKNDANFFEIVRELAEISARNRNLQLPDDSASGRRAGEYIKTHAKADHDQLLYSIVDKAIQMTGKKAPDTAASAAH
jgi:hypothetical protein